MENDETIEVLNVLHELTEKVDRLTGSINRKTEGITSPSNTYVSVNAGALKTCGMILRAQNNLLNELVEKVLTEKDTLQTMLDAFNQKKE